MKKLLISLASLLTIALLTGCVGSDSDDEKETDANLDANWTSNTTSQETCENVALGQTRRNVAPLDGLNKDLVFSQALAVWKFAVSEGQELTANLQVPANKDYNMAFFNSTGVRLACSDTGLLGESEEMTYTVASGVSTVWVKVWTASSPDNSAFTLRVNVPVPAVAEPISEVEPNDTPETAQAIDVAYSLISGGFDGGLGEDDYYQFAVNSGDIVIIKASAVIPNDSALVAIALEYSSADGDEVLDDNDTPYVHYLDEEAADFTFTVAQDKAEFFIWLNSLGNGASHTYQIEVEIQQ